MSDPKASKMMKTKGRTRDDGIQVNVSLSKDVLEDRVFTAQSSGANLKKAGEQEAGFSKTLRSRGGAGCQSQSTEAGEKSEDIVVQDQIIIAPEIMRMILEKLDLRSMKRVRLVCKSWNQEAETHMRRMSIVHLKRDCCHKSSFSEIYQNRSLTLPNPFESIHVGHHVGHKFITSLPPPLVITSFSPATLPMTVAISLIIKWSSRLEYLNLVATSCESGYLPPMDTEQTFPKLRHVYTEIPEDTEALTNHFPSIVAWIVNVSPSLEAFEFSNSSRLELGSELLLKIDVKNVKRLTIRDYSLISDHALTRFFGNQFSHLESLKVALSATEWMQEAFIATVKNSAHTLKTLTIYRWNSQRPFLEFPVCPKVQEISFESFGMWGVFLSDIFPSLQTLNVTWFIVDMFGDLWRELPPFAGLKTLRVSSGGGVIVSFYKLPFKFFEKFPSVERLGIESEFLLRCCQLKATGEGRFSNLLDGIRHLELSPPGVDNDLPPGLDYSYLRFMKDVETLTIIGSSSIMIDIPFGEMRSLKILQFPFPSGARARYDFHKLLEISRSLEKVLVSNCCSIRRGYDGVRKHFLSCFFDSAPNAECGCDMS